MPAWPRTIIPAETTPLVPMPALMSVGHSGKRQFRSTVQVGRIWTETYPAFRATSVAGRELLAALDSAWRNAELLTLKHYLYLAPNGSGGGAGPLTVNGASQTGSNLVTAGWAGANPVLRRGDIVKIAGFGYVHMMTADVNQAAGAATLPLNPPIFAGSSPANGAVITVNGGGVTLEARVIGVQGLPSVPPDGFLRGLQVTFGELV